MTRHLALSIALLVCFSGLALAQPQDSGAAATTQPAGESSLNPAAPDANNAENAPTKKIMKIKKGLSGKGEKAEEQAAPAEEETAPPVAGDVITLKNGKKLAGVQVLRETPSGLEVQVLEGVEPLKIPRKQVQSVQYDDIDPNKPGAPRPPTAEAPSPDRMPGEELSADFHAKLTAPLSDQPASFADMDFMEIIAKLSQQAGVPDQILFSDEVKQLPADLRKWTVDIKPGTSLFNLLTDTFANAFPNLALAWKYDKLIIGVKKAPVPPAPEAPTAPEAATAPEASPPAPPVPAAQPPAPAP